MKPKITAICCTYRRPELLEEALQSFLMQDYAGEKELVIINDEPEQELVFDHPQVKVYNFNERAPNLPSKHNYAVSLATGDIITIWDDDDIYLPHRFTAIAAQQKDGVWYSNYLYTDQCDDGIVLAKGMVHCNSAFTKDVFIRTGAYHEEKGMAFDFVMMNKLRSVVGDIGADNLKPSYIYRKGTKAVNYSDLSLADTIQQYEEYAERNNRFDSGKVVLSPRWTKDWSALASEAIKAKPIPLHEIDSVYKPVFSEA